MTDTPDDDNQPESALGKPGGRAKRSRLMELLEEAVNTEDVAALLKDAVLDKMKDGNAAVLKQIMDRTDPVTTEVKILGDKETIKGLLCVAAEVMGPKMYAEFIERAEQRFDLE